MKPVRPIRVVTLLILAVLAWTPGVLYAGCASACPLGDAGADHSCCPSGAAVPTVGMASCCGALEAATTEETSQAVVPATAFALSPAPPAELPGPPVAVAVVAPPPPNPPPLYEGIGLYTLHAAFLI